MRGKGRKGFRTHTYARHDNIVICATADLDDRIGSYKVDAIQLRVVRVQTTKEWPIHGVHIVGVEILRGLLCCALRLARVIVLSGSR